MTLALTVAAPLAIVYGLHAGGVDLWIALVASGLPALLHAGHLNALVVSATAGTGGRGDRGAGKRTSGLHTDDPASQAAPQRAGPRKSTLVYVESHLSR